MKHTDICESHNGKGKLDRHTPGKQKSSHSTLLKCYDCGQGIKEKFEDNNAECNISSS